MVRTLMLMFPMWAWGEWLDLHAAKEGIERRPAGYASGKINVTGDPGTIIPKGTIFVRKQQSRLPRWSIPLMNPQ